MILNFLLGYKYIPILNVLVRVISHNMLKKVSHLINISVNKFPLTSFLSVILNHFHFKFKLKRFLLHFRRETSGVCSFNKK